ncbi:MAG: HAMP domain-containing histidine kinase, partial [Ignavibacteria bacterium]|nr:HAMP domain-containing histidine kinase [Ignavibacteria bacterium]
AVIINPYGVPESGSILESVEGISIRSEFSAEMITDSRKPGESVAITYRNTSGQTVKADVTLVHYYRSYTFIGITSVAGAAFLLLGLFVVLVRPDDKAAVLLFLVLSTFAVAIITSPGAYRSSDDPASLIVRISHSLSYIFGSVFFLHFIISFPERNLKNRIYKLTAVSLYSFAVILGFVSVWITRSTISDLNSESVILYEKLWRVCELVLLVSLIAGALILVFKYRRIRQTYLKRKIEWIFWGMIMGAGPFVIFWLIPGLTDIRYIMPEEILLALLLIIPISFAIAVVKYHVLDIEVLIKRSILYFTLIGFLVLIYAGLTYLVINYVTRLIGIDSKLIFISAAILIAFMLNPLRLRIKNIVDKTFYREKYEFDKAIQSVSKKAKDCAVYSELGNMLVAEISSLIPVKSVAVAALTANGESLRIIDQRGFDDLKADECRLRAGVLKGRFDLPFSSAHMCEPDVEYNDELEMILNNRGIAVIVPLSLGPGEAIGAIILGRKLSEMRYSASDIRLLSTIASSSALALKRIELQEKLFTEHVELEKAKEISELKSYFVASVSHDLKTPLSAIRIYSELLSNDNLSSEKREEYAGVIEGETERLKRMIDNILEFSRIEKGLKKYTFEKMDLNCTVNELLSRMSYELRMKKFTTEVQLSPEPVYINGDKDSFASVLENLITNSIKYSGSNRYIRIVTSMKGGEAAVAVEDRGIGVSRENLKKIFTKFFREDSKETSGIKGAGIGLSIVKNVVEAHGGRIEVESEPGAGSRFRIILPEYAVETEDAAA